MNGNVRLILESIEFLINDLQEEFAYIEVANQWDDTVHDYSYGTAILQQLYDVHQVWTDSLA